ncbi:XRE family transcriptional regulator [Leptospira jelokensis]|uniref:ImmA/IrrE family metallo-endopeptidase n=1 Tax=Leptospira jelokensis TaxID=2484931 RepID=A0A4Z1A257_9LEPT|nr:XRE family transcriptional regulator [Leptospira jelokensis]TGL58599.1 ImmA/IrrE family metallo-endopeptidase [Leptospira jelokensis]
MNESIFNSQNLKLAREIRGLSVTELSERLSTTKQTISNYELGKRIPSYDFVQKAAKFLRFPESYFYRNNLKLLREETAFAYRSFQSATVINRQISTAKATIAINILDYLLRFLTIPESAIPIDEYDYLSLSDDEIESRAIDLRERWNIGNGPIGNLTTLLESKGVFLFYENLAEGIDAFSFWKEGIPVIVVSKKTTSACRLRMNIAHELGHLILHQSLTKEDFKKNLKLVEKQAFVFGSEFLFPSKTFSREFFHNDLEHYETLKKRWKVSIAALIEKAFHLNLISNSQRSYSYKRLNIEKKRKQEPLDDILILEEPSIIKKAIQLGEEHNLFNRNDFFHSMGVPLDLLAEFLGVEMEYFQSTIRNVNRPTLTLIK